MKSLAFRKFSLDFLIQTILFVFILSLPFLGYSWINDTFGLSLSYLLMIGFVGLASIKIIANRDFSFLKDRLIQVLLLFFFIAVLSIFMSYKAPMKEVAGEILYFKSIKHIVFLGLMISFVLALTIIVKEKSSLIKNILKFFVISGFIASLYGLYQFLGYYLNLPGIWYFVGSQGPGRKTLGFLWQNILRIQSFATEPSLLGNFLLPVLFVVLTFVLNGKKIFGKWIDLVILFLVSFNIIFTFSRGIYLIILIVFPLILLSLYKNKKEFLRSLIFLILITVMSFSFALFLPQVRDKLGDINITQRIKEISSSQDHSTSTRYNSILAAWNMFKDNPILGVGIGNYGFFYEEYKPVGALGTDSPFPVAHSFFANILAELGILGTSIFAFFVGYLVYRSWGVFIKAEPYEATLILGLILGFLAVLFHLGISIPTYSFPHFWFIVGFLISVILVLEKSFEKSEKVYK